MSASALADAPPSTSTARQLSNTARYRITHWARKCAPTRNATERLILQCYADHADPDGHNAFPSVETVAAAAQCDPRTVQNYARHMAARRLMRPDTSPPPPSYLAIPANKRPRRWEILAPASAWSPPQLEEINRYRYIAGRPPVTAETRPELAAAPARKTRCDAGISNPNRRRKCTRAAELEAGQALEALGARGESETQVGVNEKPAGGESETPNLVSALPTQDDLENPPPAVGDQPRVVRGRASTARAGAPPKRSRGQATPRRPKGRPHKRAEFVVSADAVEVYRAAMPAAIKRYIPDHAATARVFHAITVELERQAGRLGCDDPAELARQIAERAEAWRWRMVDARDPVAVVIALIVRGPEYARTAVPWCGRCEGPTPARRFVTLDDGRLQTCRDCHPSAEVAA